MGLCPFMSTPYIETAVIESNTSTVSGSISTGGIGDATITNSSAQVPFTYGGVDKTAGIVKVECRQAECQLWFYGDVAEDLPPSCTFNLL